MGQGHGSKIGLNSPSLITLADALSTASFVQTVNPLSSHPLLCEGRQE